MSVPGGPGWRSLSHAAARPPKDGPIHAAGWRVVVTCPPGSKHVTLTDSDATTALATVVAGTEVEILAWQPGARGTRYRVRSTAGGVEGWVGTASLKPRLRPPASAAVRTVTPSAHLRMSVAAPHNTPPVTRKSPPFSRRAKAAIPKPAPKSAKRGSG